MDPRRARALLAVIFAVTVLIALSATMLSVALPSIAADLGASAPEGTWMVLSYLVVNGSCLVLTGQLSDSLDLRPVFLGGVIVYTTASAALALAATPGLFIAARSVQGAGAAMLLSTAAAMISLAFPGPRLASAMGIYLAGFAVAQVSGPTVGGLVTAELGWRWLFVISASIGLACLLGGWRVTSHLPQRHSEPGLQVDLTGNLMIAAGMTALLFALSQVQRTGWIATSVLVPLAGAALLVPSFLAVERHHPHPAIALDLLRDSGFSLANLAGMLLAVPRMVPIIVLSLYLQGGLGMAPAAAALVITPLPLGVTVGSLVAGRVSRHTHPYLVALVTSAATVVGCAGLLNAVARDSDSAWLGGSLLILGLATGVFSTVNSTSIMRLRPPTEAGSVNGIRTMAQTAGVSLGTALLLSLLTAGLSAPQAAAFFSGHRSALSTQSLARLHAGLGTALLVTTALAGVATLACLVLEGRRRALETTSGTLARSPLL